MRTDPLGALLYIAAFIIVALIIIWALSHFA